MSFPGTYELPGSKRKRIPVADIETLKERHRVRPTRGQMAYEPMLLARRGARSTSFASELERIEKGAAA